MIAVLMFICMFAVISSIEVGTEDFKGSEQDYKMLYINAMTDNAYWQTMSNHWESQAEYYRTHAHCGSNNAQSQTIIKIVEVPQDSGVLGDLNNDGIVSGIDKQIMEDCLNGINQNPSCDIDCDGRIVGLDKQLFNQIANGVVINQDFIYC